MARPGRITGANVTLLPPAGQEETCQSLHVLRASGCVTSAWEFDDVEAAELLRSRTVYLAIQGDTAPPAFVGSRKAMEEFLGGMPAGSSSGKFAVPFMVDRAVEDLVIVLASIDMPIFEVVLKQALGLVLATKLRAEGLDDKSATTYLAGLYLAVRKELIRQWSIDENLEQT